MTFEYHKPAIRVFDRVIDKFPEEMILDIEILGSGRNSLVSSQEVCSLIILKDTAVDFRAIDRKTKMIKDKLN